MSPRSREGRSPWQGRQAGRLGQGSLGQGERPAPLNSDIPSGGKAVTPRSQGLFAQGSPLALTCQVLSPSQPLSPSPTEQDPVSISESPGHSQAFPIQALRAGLCPILNPHPGYSHISLPSLRPTGQAHLPSPSLLQALGRALFLPRGLTWEGGWHVQDLGHPLGCGCSSMITGRP